MSTHSVTPSVHPGLISSQILASCPPMVTASQITSAMRGTSPIVGIPIEGREPLRLDRKRLTGAMKGVSPVEITVIDHGNGRTSLQVEGVSGPRVRTRFRIMSFARPAVRMELRKWADSEAVRISKPKPVKGPGKAGAVLAKLERELVKSPEPSRIQNPAVPRLYTRTMNESCRAEIIRWRAEKRSRTILGAIGKNYRGESTTKLYAYLRSMGFVVKTYSEIDHRSKERQDITSIFAYQSKLWMFCGLLAEKPYDLTFDRGEWFMPEWGAERYIPYLNAQNQRASLQAQIDSIRAMTQI